MAKFTVTAPDGKEYDVEAPEGATEQQVLEYVKANFQGAAAAEPPGLGAQLLRQAGLGARDVVQGLSAPIEPTAAAEPPGLGAQLRRQAGLGTRAVVQGLSAPVNVVADFVSGAANLGLQAVGSETRVPFLSQAQSRGLSDLGLPSPETPIERAVSAGMQGLVSAGGMAAALPRTVFGADLARQLPAATAAPAVAEPVAETVKDLTGSDLAAFVAAVGVSGATGKGAGKLADRVIAGRQPVITMDQVRQNAQRSYTQVSDLGIKLKQGNANDLVAKLKTRLDDRDYIPENAAPVKNALKSIESVVKRGDITFDKVEKMRGLANTLKTDTDANVRRLGRELVSGIDEHVAGLKPRDVSAGKGGIDEAVRTIAGARKDWRNLSRASMLENILDVAEAKALNPTASESELIRRGFITLAANKEKMRFFTNNEQNAIKGVAKGSSLDPLMSMLAKFNPQRSQLVTAGAAGGGIASPESLMYTVPLATAGFSADKLQALLRRRSAEQVMGGLLSGNTAAPTPQYFSRGLLSTIMTQPGVPE